MCSVAVNFSKLANWVLTRTKACSTTSFAEHESPCAMGRRVSTSGGDQEISASIMDRSAMGGTLGGGILELSGVFPDVPGLPWSLRFAAAAEGSEGKSSTSFCHVLLASSVLP